jgi:hypothetical protein
MDIDTPRQKYNCVREKCRVHQGKCPNNWIMVPEVHDFLHRLPGELQRMVIAETVVPQPRCIKHVFGHCHNPWECKYAHPINSASQAVLPSSCYTSICRLVHKEGYKAFFQNNVFVFKSLHRTYPRLHSTDPEEIRIWFRSLDSLSIRDRDPRALRILDFLDVPIDSNLHIQSGDGSYEHIGTYRRMIRHLVFTLEDDAEPVSDLAVRYTWAWALTVDWSSLPNLETLVLDLRGYSYRQLQDPEMPEDLYNEQLEAGAKRLKCLSLKSLVIYGLCSGPLYWDKIQHRKRMEKLFQPALGKLGKLELRDEEHFVEW